MLNIGYLKCWSNHYYKAAKSTAHFEAFSQCLLVEALSCSTSTQASRSFETPAQNFAPKIRSSSHINIGPCSSNEGDTSVLSNETTSYIGKLSDPMEDKNKFLEVMPTDDSQMKQMVVELDKGMINSFVLCLEEQKLIRSFQQELNYLKEENKKVSILLLHMVKAKLGIFILNSFLFIKPSPLHFRRMGRYDCYRTLCTTSTISCAAALYFDKKEGRKYEVTMKSIDNRLHFADGWELFDIRKEYTLFFECTSLTNFTVTVGTYNGVERRPQYRFTLHVKRMHVQHARFVTHLTPLHNIMQLLISLDFRQHIPMSFWKSHIKNKIRDTRLACLMFKGVVYSLQVIERHGKKLMEHGGAKEFIEHVEIVEGSICSFTLLPAPNLSFRVVV
ncbi:olfactory receptor, partial [Striga asiatica]